MSSKPLSTESSPKENSVPNSTPISPPQSEGRKKLTESMLRNLEKAGKKD